MNSNYENNHGYNAGHLNTIKLESVGGAFADPLLKAVDKIQTARAKRIEAEKRRAFQTSEREARQTFDAGREKQNHDWKQEDADLQFDRDKEKMGMQHENRLDEIGVGHDNRLDEIGVQHDNRMEENDANNAFKAGESAKDRQASKDLENLRNSNKLKAISAKGAQDRATAQAKAKLEEAGIDPNQAQLNFNTTVYKPTPQAIAVDKEYQNYAKSATAESKEKESSIKDQEKAQAMLLKKLNQFKAGSEKRKVFEAKVKTLGAEIEKQKSELQAGVPSREEWLKKTYGSKPKLYAKKIADLTSRSIDTNKTNRNIQAERIKLINGSGLKGAKLKAALSIFDNQNKSVIAEINKEFNRDKSLAASASKEKNSLSKAEIKAELDLFKNAVKSETKSFQESDEYKEMSEAERIVKKQQIIKDAKKLYKINNH